MCFGASAPDLPPPPPPPPRFVSKATQDAKRSGRAKAQGRGGFRTTISGTAAGILSEAATIRRDLVGIPESQTSSLRATQ